MDVIVLIIAMLGGSHNFAGFEERQDIAVYWFSNVNLSQSESQLSLY